MAATIVGEVHQDEVRSGHRPLARRRSGCQLSLRAEGAVNVVADYLDVFPLTALARSRDFR